MWLQSREFLTVSRNWFISQNPDFFISQNPDFINVIKNVDFAKSRFFLFRKIQLALPRATIPETAFLPKLQFLFLPIYDPRTANLRLYFLI